jgi:transglutaminase-like putative cysteine protease
MTPDSINADITTALIATEMVNSSHDSVQALAQEIVRGVEGTRERAVAIYYAVRDGFRYDPYEIGGYFHELLRSKRNQYQECSSM